MTPKNNETAIADLALAIGLLVRRIRSSAPAEIHDLSWTQKAVIARLDKEGPMTTAELARAEGVKPQSMGVAVALLEEIGMLERKAHPTDGRQVNIRLTSKALALRKSLKEAKETWLSQAIDRLSKQEQATLFAAGDVIKRLVEL
jgi:DNA-binding MarR family transcriptional regulator